MISKTKKKIPAITAIQAWNRQRRIKIDLETVKIFCGALAKSLNISNRAFSVIFIGTATMRRLNNEWREKDYATDVLSFAYDGELVDGLPFLGEIVIAPEIAVRQAVEYGALPEREIRKLIVHGALHLMGYDHETDGGEMISMQKRVLRRRFFTATPRLTRQEKDR
jgi:probable rRNA maturation factor